MKNKNLFIPVALFIFALSFLPTSAHAGSLGDFKQTINVDVNCSYCITETKSLDVQLFADGQPVEGKTATLTKETGYKTTFEDLDVFKGAKTPELIDYEVKVLKDGKYKSMFDKQVSYETQTINKWIQIAPEDLKPGHSYALMTENWNYENNGHDNKYVFMSSDLELDEATAEANYTIVDGKKSYFALTTEPEDISIWKFDKISSDDPDYANYKNTWTLTGVSSGSKPLVLSDFVYDDHIDTIWRYSSKNGYNQGENSYNTNKLSIIPVDNTRGRFFIAGKTADTDGVLSDFRYAGVSHFYSVVAQTEPDYSAQFLAFEYVENQKVQVATDFTYTMELCSKESAAKPDNPNTVDHGQITLFSSIFGVSSLALACLLHRMKRH
ncbi:Cna B-type domain-containing protein [Candidatus Saccharibacteria bacterium]|nr:Cna B-type domain-containing protein [Candidatus Saccharibacteria bacterium]